MGDGDGDGFGEVAFVGVSAGHREGPEDAGGFEFGGEGVGLVVGGVGAFGEVVGASDDDGGVGGDQEIGAEVCVAAADDDGFEITRDGPVDGGGDLVVVVGVDEDWVLVFIRKCCCDGFEFEIDGIVFGGVGCCVIEDGVEVFEGLVSAVVGFLLVLAGVSHSWPVDNQACVAGEGHVFVGPAVGLEDRGASGDGASGWEDAEGEDAVGSCGGDDGGVWIDRDIGADLGGHVADFVVVVHGADGGDFLEPECGDRIDHAGVEVFAGEVDDLGVGGEADARHDLVVGDDADFAFGDGDDAVGDCFAGDCVDGGADEEDGVVLRQGGGGEVLGGGQGCGEGEGGDDFGGVFHGDGSIYVVGM